MGRSCLLTARVMGCSREPDPPARMMPLIILTVLERRVRGIRAFYQSGTGATLRRRAAACPPDEPVNLSGVASGFSRKDARRVRISSAAAAFRPRAEAPADSALEMPGECILPGRHDDSGRREL